MKAINYVLGICFAKKCFARSIDLTNAAATQTVKEEIVLVYKKARIPINHLKNMALEIPKLYQ